MNEKSHVKKLTEFELECMYSSIKEHLEKHSDQDLQTLQNLLKLLENEIHNRKIDKE